MDPPSKKGGPGSGDVPRAPLVAAVLRCLYCGRQRKVAGDLCDGCGAEPPNVPCSACGRSVVAPLVACVCGAPCGAWRGAEKEGLPCPRCDGSIWRVQLDVSSVHVEQCSRCLGCFARAGDFSELLDREEAGEAMALRRFVPVAEERKLPRQALLASVRCPHCRREMERVRFAQRASLIVDVCPAHGVWLDAGELIAVLDFIKQRSQGDLAPGKAEREDDEMWDKIATLRAHEERMVDLHATRAEGNLLDGSGRGMMSAKVLAATALGGPWLGMFVALKANRSRR